MTLRTKLNALMLATTAALCSGVSLAAVVYKDVGELTPQSRQIVIGDVVEVTSFRNAKGNLIKSRIVVSVTDYLLGKGTGTEVLEMDGGTAGGQTLRVSVLPVFEVGQHVLLFLGDSKFRLVESFQGAYLTDGEQIARMAPACGCVIEESLQPLDDFLDEIQRALPEGITLGKITPYKGGFQLPLGGARYVLCGVDWTYMPNPMGEVYRINANCVDGSAGSAESQRTQIRNGSDAWDNAGADFAFTYGGTSSQTSATYNGTNLVYFDTTPPGGGGYVAVTYMWASGSNMTECDMIFNDADYTWWNGSGSCGGNKFDIWSVAAHEFGHFLCLGHSSNPSATMYFAGGPCETHMRTLHQDDINGIIAIYGTGTPTGACCLTDGSCSVQTLSDCNTTGGTYQGDGTDCSPNPCPQPTGACCFLDDLCDEITLDDCNTIGGTYLGDGTTCTPNPCLPPTGACCLADGSCFVTESDLCNLAGGTYQGDGTDCGGADCPSPCPADLDGDGTIGPADLAMLLTCWGTPCGDLNNDGTTDPSDLAILLANWGPCAP